MGMFDSIFFTCPKCGAEVEEQSKASRCMLDRHTEDAVPYDIALDINGAHIKCYNCNSTFKIESVDIIEPPPVVKMKLVIC